MEGIKRGEGGRSSRGVERGAEWGALEEFARVRIQGWIQDLLEEEVTELLGRRKSQRRAAGDGPGGGVRGLEQRFESRIWPLFARRTREVAELLPQLYLHGLAEGDFELALRGLLGEGAPLSASAVEGRAGKWR